MNERIRSLLDRAEYQAEKYPGPDWEVYVEPSREQILEKFAELVVAECIEQVRGEFLPVLEDETMMKDTHWDGYVQCGVDSVVAIREHFFGVEE
jgi:hypothetical protein